MPLRVFLHVGSPKTGTTFLQNVLWTQRALARENGLLLPLRSFHDHFLATLDVRELTGRGRYRAFQPGSWDSVVREAEAWAGNVLVSHELFAGATQAQAEKALGAFAEETEVHVVATARDLMRQIPAEWQEHVKHRYSEDLPDFLLTIKQDPDHDTWFWRVQDVPDVLDRWGHTLPRDRVHVVTVPPVGSDPTILWRRFAELVDLDADAFDLEQSRSNTSLGQEQTELLRRFNSELGSRLRQGAGYPGVVKEVLAHQVLSGRQGTPLLLTGADLDFAVQRSEEMVKRLRGMRVHVVGDLEDLVPPASEPAKAVVDPAVTDETILEEALEALIGMCEAHLATRERIRTSAQRVSDLEERVQRLEAEQAQFVHDWQHRPVRHLLVGLSERWRAIMALRRGYQACKVAVRDAAMRVRDWFRRS